MVWEWFVAYHHFLPALTLLLSAGLTLTFSRRGRRIWLAAIVGVLAPSILILVGFGFWDAQQPNGGFLLLLGWVNALYNLLFGLLGAVAAALYRVLRLEMSAE